MYPDCSGARAPHNDDEVIIPEADLRLFPRRCHPLGQLLGFQGSAFRFVDYRRKARHIDPS